MSIEIVAIGNEVLEGATINTNAAYLGRRLSEEGWDVARHTTIADDVEKIVEGLKEALSRAQFVIVTGGLGPTVDDLTRAAAAGLLKEKPEEVPNSAGHAPGILYPKLMLLPGVPYEMEAMFETSTIPYLRKNIPPQQKFSAVIHLAILDELEVDPLLRTLKGVEAGVYPGYGTVTVRLHAKDKTALERAKEAIMAAFKEAVFPSASGKIEEAIHAWFCQHKQTLALAESCTGGLMAARLTALPGASDYFLGSLVTYSNSMKEKILGVKPQTLKTVGAVSSQTVAEMLAGIFHQTAADYGIAVSGIAGPTGGTAQKPVGTVWYALGKRGQAPEVGTFISPAKTRQTIVLSTATRLFGLLWKKIR